MTMIQKDTIKRMRSEGYSFSQISKVIGISVNTLKSYCRRNKFSKETGNEDIKREHEIEDVNICKYCSAAIDQIPKQKPKKFCSEKCRTAWWKINADSINKKAIYKIICKNCNREFESYSNKDRKYCSHECYIEDRFTKGGIES